MVEINNLTKIYSNGKGIKNINISFTQSEVVGLIGDNGAGKSTIIKCVFKEILKDSGDVFFDSESIYSSKTNYFAYFPDQSSYPKNVKIIDYMIYYAALNNIDPKEAKETAEYYLKYFDLYQYKNKQFKTLSAGMQKKALLCIALIIKPKVIFLDEPTANLDIKSRLEVIKILKELVEENHISLFITSHLVEELQGLINKIYIIDDGEITFSKNLDNNDNIMDIYLQNSKKIIPKEKLIIK